MRPAAASVLAVCAVLAFSGCGSSKHEAAKAQSSTPETTSAATQTAPAATRSTTTATKEATPTTGPDTAPPVTVASAPTATTSTKLTETQSSVVQQSLCPSEQQPGIAANFGFRHTRAGAILLIRKAREFGFQNLTVQRRACARYAAVLTGLKNIRQARDFEKEARSVGLSVLLECRSRPIRGGLAAVFGHRNTRRGAVALKRRAESNGFLNLQVQQDRCGDWEVDLYGVLTPTARADLRKEAASVGYHITFEPG